MLALSILENAIVAGTLALLRIKPARGIVITVAAVRDTLVASLTHTEVL